MSSVVLPLSLVEDAVLLHQSRGLVVIAHSLGNNIFRYFLHWIQRHFENNEELATTWIQRHIAAYFCVGAPFLGSSESIEALITGLSLSLPLSRDSMRHMQTSHGVTQWLLPFPRSRSSSKSKHTMATSTSIEKDEKATDEDPTDVTATAPLVTITYRDMSIHEPTAEVHICISMQYRHGRH
jgi:hypothetical protein